MEQRVRYLVGKNSGWATEKGYPHLIARLSFEMGQLAQVVTERTNILTGTDPTSPQHRDLEDAAKRLTTDGSAAIAAQARINVAQRKERIAQIIWRAGAIQPELWGGGDSTPMPTLNKAALVEMVDRRLHSVEMLIFHDEWKVGSWSLASATSGWKDEQRTSMFQYPWVRFADSNFTQALSAAGLTVAALAPDWIESVDEINYKLQQRLRPAAAGDWSWDQMHYVMSLKPGVQDVAAALAHMMPPAPKIDPNFEDFMDRNFVYCDIMLAALHIEGLRFSRRRRAGNDNEFNASATVGVTLRPLIPETGPPGPNWLMANGAKWFEGVAVPHDALQVGDHLVFWNNQFVRFILGSAFGLENSFVTRIGPNGHDIMLAGHGMLETIEQKFAEEMADEMQRTYDKLATFLNSKTAPLPAVIGAKSSRNRRFQLVNWAPFKETFTPDSVTTKLKQDGAWWIRLTRKQLRDNPDDPNLSNVPTMAAALAMIPQSVRVDIAQMTPPTLPAGSFDADYQESIYLPLSVPARVSGGWPTYFAKHKGPGDVVGVVDLIPDGKMVPGFFKLGAVQNSQVPGLRPKVQP